MKDNIMVGKVTKYDGSLGEIITEDNIYYFTKNDILENININDIVIFKGKSEDIFPQAYYIKMYKKQD